MSEKTEIYFGKDARDILNAHTQILGMHYRALACHCECLGMNAENMQAAESRIRDTDMAYEMSKFTKDQILVQSATAMLAQANAQPQLILRLLQ